MVSVIVQIIIAMIVVYFTVGYMWIDAYERNRKR